MMSADPVATLPTSRTERALARPAAPRQASLFLPVLLPSLALVCWLAFQAFLQASDYRQLAAARANLDAQVQAATRIRGSLDALAGATARLAQGGNANAQGVVEQLRKRGITINAAASPKP